MPDNKKFDKAGDTDDRETWNKAGTRRWRVTYTLVEVKPSWRKTKTPDVAEESSIEEGAKSAKQKKVPPAKPKKTISGKTKRKG